MPEVGVNNDLRRSSRLNRPLQGVRADVEEEISFVGNSNNTNPMSSLVHSSSHVVPADIEEEIYNNKNYAVLNPVLRDPPPLNFCRPRWYQYPRFICADGTCLDHVRICEEVNMTLLLSKSPTFPPEKLKEKIDERNAAINFWQLKILQAPMVEAPLQAVSDGDPEEEDPEKEKEKKKMEEEEEEWRILTKMRERKYKTKETSEQYDKKWMRMWELRTWRIEQGQQYDVLDLVGTPTRDYLINHNGDKFDIEDHLSGKYVLFYFLCLPDSGFAKHETNCEFILDLKETYNTYHPQGKFEVVFIALGTNEGAFNDAFSMLPGLAIPHDDQVARDYFIMKFYIPPRESATPVLFDPNGKVLLEHARHSFFEFGSQGFPFTTERLDHIWYKFGSLWDRILLEKDLPSLTEFFGEHVTSPEGKKVRTNSVFEGKIVGLHFFEISPMGFRQTRKLLDFWNSLKQKHKEFEIVFIRKGDGHPSIAKDAFEKEFGHPMPWYSPLSDGSGRQLCRVFNQSGCPSWYNCRFIILKRDRYDCLSYFAFQILKEFGTGAYPFTLENAVKFEISRQKKILVLHQLLSPSAPLCRGGSEWYKENNTTVSMLSGKRVLLLFATLSCYQSGSFLPQLKKMYESKGATDDDDFEIIYISLDCRYVSEAAFPKSVKEMPWLLHSFVPDFGSKLVIKVFGLYPQLPAIVAFRADGHLQTKESNLVFKKKWEAKYPFIQGDMDEEVHKELIYFHPWALERPTHYGPCP